MTHRTSDNLGGLDIDLVRRIDEVCRRFEADWRAGHQPRIEEYFGEFTGDARASLAAELEALRAELQQAPGTAGIADAPTIAPGSLPTLPTPGEASSSVHDVATLPPREDATVDLGSSAPASLEAGTPSHVRYFGDYEISREIARGGMGVVFEARQVSLNRKVALKMILAGQLADEIDVKRFYTEAEAAANLDHPGIVPIFEVGQHEGQHYFSMGFVEGQSLSQCLANGPLPAREAAELVRRVSEAIEYAHRRGVIHRDLKPANILLDKNGNPRVTDFGLAKKVEGDSGLTGSGQIMGTPSYMPPEQAGGPRGEVGPAADVYALGATLYALVTGRPPFQAATAMDTVIQVISDEPVPPRRLNPSISRDLETICLKCLEKEPARRYASAAALAEELARFLAGEPILARPIGGPERLWRWCRRRPVVAGLGSAVAALSLFVAVAGLLVAVSQSHLRALAEDRAKEARTAQGLAQSAQKAEAARRLEAEQAGYEASTKALAADQTLVRSYLSQAENLRNLVLPGRQGRALELLKRASGLKHDTDSLAAKLGADSAGWRPAMTQFWREQRPRLRSEATRWFDELSLKRLYETRFPVLLTRDRATLQTCSIMTSRSGLAQSDDGKWLAYFRVGLDDTDPSGLARFVEIIDADKGKVVRSLKVGQSFQRMNTLAFDAPDQDVLVARAEQDDSQNRVVYLIERWSRGTGKVKGTVSLPVAGSGPQAGRLVFSADRKSLLSIPGEPGKRATVWDLAAAKPLREFEDDFAAETFFPDGRRIIGMTGSDIVIRDVKTGGVTKRWPMPDGLVSILGNVRNSSPFGRSAGDALQPDAQSLWVSPDGSWVAAYGQHPLADNFFNSVQMPTTVFLFDAESGQIRVRIPIPDVPTANLSSAPAPPLAFDAASRLLAVATTKSLALFSVPQGAPLISQALPELNITSPGPPPRMAGDPVFTMPTCLLFARGTNRLFAAAHPSDLSGSPIGSSMGGPSDSPKLVEQAVWSWDVILPRTRTLDHRHDGIVRAVKLDPRDRFVTAAGDDRMIRAWDRRGGLRWSVGYPGAGSVFSHTVLMPGEQTSGHGGIFDPTGSVFFTRILDRIDVWDAASGVRRGSFTSALAKSPDNRYLVVTRGAGPPPARQLRILDVSRNETVLSIPLEQNSPIDLYGQFGFKGLVGGFPQAMFSPDSRFFVVAGQDKPGPEARNSTLLIADLALARVVARVQIGGEWAIGPASKVLVVSDTAPAKPPVLHAYALATGRQIGEFISPIPGFSSLPYDQDRSSWIAPDDRRMAVRLLKETYPRQEVKLFVWPFDNGQAIPIPIAGNWEPMNMAGERSTYFDGDGTRLVFFGSQKTGPNTNRPVVELWDLAGPRRLMSTADAAPELAMLPPRLLFNPGQRAFATFHNRQKNAEGIGAILWETATGKVLGRYKGDLAFGSRRDGDYLQLDDKGKISVIWLKTGEARAIPGRAGSSHFFGVPGLYTAASVDNAGVILTDAETGRTRAVLPGQGMFSVPFTPDGKLLSGPFTSDGKRLATFSRGTPALLSVWEVETGKLLRSVPFHDALNSMGRMVYGGFDVHFSPDGRRLAFNLNDRFRVLDVESGRLVAIDRPGHRAAIRAVDVSPDDTLVASAGDDAAVCLWEAATGHFVAMLEEETDPIAGVAFSPDGRSLAARAATGRVRVWRLDHARAGDRIKIVATPAWDTTSLGSAAGASATSGPVFVSRGRLVAFGAGDGTIALRDATSGRVEQTLKPESGQAAVTALTVRADGERLASADAEGIVRIWELSAEAPPIRLVADRGAIRTVAFAGNIVAVAGGSLELWDAGAGERLVTLEADARAVNCLELSADGRILASGDDRKLALRDLHELRRLMAEIELGW